jgi:hypothetical protein
LNTIFQIDFTYGEYINDHMVHHQACREGARGFLQPEFTPSGSADKSKWAARGSEALFVFR